MANVVRLTNTDQTISLKETKSGSAKCHGKIHEVMTPSVKTLLTKTNVSSMEHNTRSNSVEAHEKLRIWKKMIEQSLNQVYLEKVEEINHLIAQGENSIDVMVTAIPSFEQSILVQCRQNTVDHYYDDIEFDYSKSQTFDLTTNSILLCASHNYVLIYDNIVSNLILYSSQSKLNSYSWKVEQFGEPCDLTYSYYLKMYCIITNHGLFTWSYENPSMPLHIDSVKFIGVKRLWTIATTDIRSDVFVLFQLGSYVERWHSIAETKSWHHIKRWSNHNLFERNDQRIRAIRMTSNYVAWTVESMTTNQWRVDLLDYDLQMIRHGINIANLDKCSSCLLSNFFYEQYLIIDSNFHRLFVLDSHGCIKLQGDSIIDRRIRNAVVVNNNHQRWLVIRLEKPNQLCFIPIVIKTETT